MLIFILSPENHYNTKKTHLLTKHFFSWILTSYFRLTFLYPPHGNPKWLAERLGKPFDLPGFYFLPIESAGFHLMYLCLPLKNKTKINHLCLIYNFTFKMTFLTIKCRHLTHTTLHPYLVNWPVRLTTVGCLKTFLFHFFIFFLVFSCRVAATYTVHVGKVEALLVHIHLNINSNLWIYMKNSPQNIGKADAAIYKNLNCFHKTVKTDMTVYI